MRSGDTVKHLPTGETWTVAYVKGPYLAWFGWPEGEARVSDCELIEACSDAEHRKALEEWGGKPHRRDDGFMDNRHHVCFEQLCELNKSFVGAGI